MNFKNVKLILPFVLIEGAKILFNMELSPSEISVKILQDPYQARE